MASKSKRGAVKRHGNDSKTNGHGAAVAARSLQELKTIGGLLVRSSVGLLNGDAADQFVWLGRQIQLHADQGMAALGPRSPAAPPAAPRRRPRP